MLCLASQAFAQSGVAGRVLDPQGKSVAQARVTLEINHSTAVESHTDTAGAFRFDAITPGQYRVTVDSPGFQPGSHDVNVPPGVVAICDVTLAGLAQQRQSIVIDAKAIEPGVDLRNSEVFTRTLFTRDDQLMHQLNAGIDAGQHEGETQNYFESRISPDAPVVSRIHATPAFPLTAVVGLTFRLGGK